MRKLWILLAVVAVMAVSAFGYRYYLISELRKPVLERLTDPDTALFRNEWLLFGWFNWPPTANVLCGEVNAKNRMGGYAGYVKFSSNSGIDVNIGDDGIGLSLIELTCKTQ